MWNQRPSALRASLAGFEGAVGGFLAAFGDLVLDAFEECGAGGVAVFEGGGGITGDVGEGFEGDGFLVEVAFFAGEAEEVEQAGDVVAGPDALAGGQAEDEVRELAEEDIAAGGGLEELEADGGRVGREAA